MIGKKINKHSHSEEESKMDNSVSDVEEGSLRQWNVNEEFK